MHAQLPNERIYSLDLLRGITILLMIFVNEVAGIKNIPLWLKHAAADVDAMTLADWVFPGFLFIVGMSIPVALQNRLRRGTVDGERETENGQRETEENGGSLKKKWSRFWALQQHILIRTIGLLVLGVFMVNAEAGYHEASMGMPISLWSLFFYLAVVLVWNVYHEKNKFRRFLWRGTGLTILLVLALIYRGGEDGSEYLQPRWWGILGLIGWSYFYSSIFYQISQGRKWVIGLAIIFCTGVYIAGHSDLSHQLGFLGWTTSFGGHATHTAISLCGILLTLILFDKKNPVSFQKRVIGSIIFAFTLFLVGLFLRPYFQLGKVHATPTWGLYCSAISVILFIAIYWLVDILQAKKWTSFFQPAGSNPLLTYIIPFILWAVYDYFDFYPLPDEYRTGILGISFCIAYALLIMGVVKILNKAGLRLHL